MARTKPNANAQASVALLAIAVLGSCVHAPGSPGEPRPNPVNEAPVDPVSLGTLDYQLLPEASGLAVSRQYPDTLWLINDQGNSATLISVNRNTMAATAVRVEGARNRDWEDLALFELNARQWILIPDVGDNEAVRDTVALYLVPEPAPDATRTEPALQLTLTYEDGPRDVEAVAVDVARDSIFLLSKRTSPPALYRVPLSEAIKVAGQQGRLVARKLGPVFSIPAPTALELKLFPKFGQYRNQPTAMALRPDGREIALLTYGEAYRIPLSSDQTWLEAMNEPLQGIGMPVLRQPETIAWDDSGALYITSEGRNAPVLFWPSDND